MEWQPIETAPKDETWVLLYGEHGGADYSPHMDVAQYAHGGWITYHLDEHAEPKSPTCTPTHWQPLPERPGINIEKEPTEPERSDR